MYKHIESFSYGWDTLSVIETCAASASTLENEYKLLKAKRMSEKFVLLLS